jgi:hypothetical protein
MTNYTTKELAKALGIGPRTRKFTIQDEYGISIDAGRTESVLATLSRTDKSEVPQRIHTVAYALLKSISTARMNPVTSLRLTLDTSAYQICAIVAKIANECPEQEIGGICDVWLPKHHTEL